MTHSTDHPHPHPSSVLQINTSFHPIKSSNSSDHSQSSIITTTTTTDPTPDPDPSSTNPTFINLTNQPSSSSSSKSIFTHQFQTDQDFINHILHHSSHHHHHHHPHPFKSFLNLDSNPIHDQLTSPILLRHRFSSIWRSLDPRKPNRYRKFLERTRSKLNTSTFQQVHQIILFHSILNTLTDYHQTLNRFHSNSSNLHQCLIKWDKLKSKDQTFSRLSLEISLNLQDFMEDLHSLYPTSYLAITPNQEAEEAEEVEEEVEEEGEGEENPNEISTPNPNRSSNQKKISLRTHLLIRFKLHSLRTQTKRFNKQFESHEREKSLLKLNGNQCIFNMVQDGKGLLEINDRLVKLILDLIILRKDQNSRPETRSRRNFKV
ncbi:hypothetical protein DFH28DRAFT_923356 [Melampsora americana]|nr:hypothetical protein DFH28DRAFT_923356 [Melampsora americana]